MVHTVAMCVRVREWKRERGESERERKGEREETERQRGGERVYFHAQHAQL